MKDKYLYAAREKTTGKLVCDITNPGKKFWQNKANALQAINRHNSERGAYHYARHGELELVVYKLIEVKECETE